jgi:hypothetical protein
LFVLRLASFSLLFSPPSFFARHMADDVPGYSARQPSEYACLLVIDVLTANVKKKKKKKKKKVKSAGSVKAPA